MRCRLYIPIIVLTFLVSSAVLAQGDYLKYGESGVYLGYVSQAGNNFEWRNGGSIGFSFLGVVDVVGSMTGPSEIYGLGFALHPLKQDGTNSPVGISFAYCMVSNRLENFFNDITSSYGMIIFSNLRIKKELIIQPSIYFANQGIKPLRIYGPHKGYFGVGPGLSLFVDLAGGDAAFRIDTIAMIGDERIVFGLGMGFLFKR